MGDTGDTGDGTRGRLGLLRLQLDPAGQVRLLATLLLALSVAAVDQCVKVAIATPVWAYHHRSPSWFFVSWALCFVVPILAVVPSRAVLVGAALLTGGMLGNVLSASTDGLTVANPLVVGHTSGVAFNVADLCIITGNMVLVVSLMTLAIRHRDRIDGWNATLRQAVRHRL